jgi:hypothetical protein
MVGRRVRGDRVDESGYLIARGLFGYLEVEGGEN